MPALKVYSNMCCSLLIAYASEQHKAAMACLTEERAQSAKLPMASYAPIASSLQSTLDPAAKEKVMKKFDITYCLTKENLPFTKYTVIHELLEYLFSTVS